VRIEATGLASFKKLVEKLPETTVKAAKFALNDTAQKKALPRFRRAIADQVAFPGGYLNKERLGITKRATESDLSVAVTARFRPTSLARFASGQTVEGSRRTRQVRVRVKKGRSAVINGGFLVRLRGAPDGFNTGLAIRLRAGERLRGSSGAVRLDNNVYLLYGPSVDQVFRGVAVDETEAVLVDLETEFRRQFVRLAGEG
jgi:hypothetical protein